MASAATAQTRVACARISIKKFDDGTRKINVYVRDNAGEKFDYDVDMPEGIERVREAVACFLAGVGVAPADVYSIQEVHDCGPDESRKAVVIYYRSRELPAGGTVKP